MLFSVEVRPLLRRSVSRAFVPDVRHGLPFSYSVTKLQFAPLRLGHDNGNVVSSREVDGNSVVGIEKFPEEVSTRSDRVFVKRVYEPIQWDSIDDLFQEIQLNAVR